METHAPVYYHETDVYPYRPIEPIWMLVSVSVTFVFFFVVDRWTRPANRNDWLRQNTLLSWIHSTICSVLVVVAVLRAPEMFEDPLSHANHFNYCVIAFTVGYFLWDLRDCLRNSTASILPIAFHHAVAMTFLIHVLLRTRNIGYALYALSLEINSVFLHARRLLRRYGLAARMTLLARVVDVGNYITFVIFRFGVVLEALRILAVQRHRFPLVIHIFTVFSVSAIGVLNVVLFWRLLKDQFGSKRKSKSKGHAVENDVMMPSE